MIEEKTMCDRVGKNYVYILEKMCNILRHCHLDFYIDDKSIEKIEELCLGLETGKMEIIEFGEVLSKRNNIDKYKTVLDKIKEYARELRLFDNESVEFEISNKILEILEEIK